MSNAAEHEADSELDRLIEDQARDIRRGNRVWNHETLSLDALGRAADEPRKLTVSDDIHGTVTGYSKPHRCRCLKCRAAWASRARLLRSMGRWGAKTRRKLSHD